MPCKMRFTGREENFWYSLPFAPARANTIAILPFDAGDPFSKDGENLAAAINGELVKQAPELRVTADSRAIIEEMLITPIQQLAARAWTKETGADLRRALNRLIEEQVERKLRTTVILEAL